MTPAEIAKSLTPAQRASLKFSVSVSGGKDSQAMLYHIVRSFPDTDISIVHSDLGRAEWKQTPGFVESLAREVGRPLYVVRRAKGDLVSRIEDRLKSVSTLDPARPAKPFWPSAAQRYCTSDLKRDPIAKHHRWLVKDGILISCMGIRAEESPRRKNLPVLSVNNRISSQKYRGMSSGEALAAYTGGRLVIEWLPIHDWSVAHVWEGIGSSQDDIDRRRRLYRDGRHDEAMSGWPGHPAYVIGNERLSCAICVLASENDIANGIVHHPELYQIYSDLETQSTYTFRDNWSLRDFGAKLTSLGLAVREELEKEEQTSG